MTTEILNKKEKNEIDWSVPQWVMFNDILVFTNGIHKEDEFSGTCLPHPFYPKGSRSSDWNKCAFKPIPKEGLTIKITNE